MKKFDVNSVKVAAVSAATLAASAAPCFAVDELATVAAGVDPSNFIAIAVALGGALVTFWGIKKALSALRS